MTDARFEDASEAPLNLGAVDGDDLVVVSSLVQDAVFTAGDIAWSPANGQFTLLLNRFRWEDGARKERVRALLVFRNVRKIASTGIDRTDKETVLSVLSVEFEQNDAPAGFVTITLAGDGALRLDVEAVEATLKDVTKPYLAPSGRTPAHPD